MRKIPRRKKEFLIEWSSRKQKKELKRWRKRRTIRLQKLAKKVRDSRKQKFYESYKHAEVITLPASESFSILDDTEIVLEYFEKAKRHFNENSPVFFDLSKIKHMDPATLTYLCALLKDKKITKGIPLRGNIPRSPALKEMFIQSGFEKIVHTSFKYSDHTDKYGELIHETKVKVESAVAKRVCLSSLDHTFGKSEIKPNDLFVILIECMANTHNHASLGSEIAIYNWWLLAYKNSTTRVTTFCFLDIGVGIFESLSTKHFSQSLQEVFEKCFIPNNSIKTLQQIFSGNFNTSTHRSERGRGIKTIYDRVKKNPNIRNFTLITNDVKAHIGYNSEDYIEKLATNFQGTLYTWELISDENT